MGKKDNRAKYGLVGEKLGHSFSPLLHSRFGEYDYSLIEVSKENIDDYFRQADFNAINVTIPYKEKAMAYCTPDDKANAIGCVNTLVNTGNGVMGYNTDTYGFEYMAVRAGIDFRGEKVVILGSGGTCKTAAYTVSRLGAASVTVVSRNPSDVRLDIPCPIRYAGYDDDFYDCTVLVNTTPVGMYPDVSGKPIDINNCYVNLKAVIDVIYNPLSTRLIYNAKKRGLKATGGLPMLVSQGYFASRLFAGETLGADPVGALTDVEREKLEKVIDDICNIAGNVVLTGMPGSGKTTVGKIMAKKLGLEFADTDIMFEKEYGMSPSKCIRQMGEEKFRELEKKIVSTVAQKGGKVIATGGGVVLDPENMEMLSLNGKVIFINRKLNELATADRPLSAGAENLKALYYRRLPIYISNCDMTVRVEGSAKSVAASAIGGLHNSEAIKRTHLIVVNGPNLNMLGVREPGIYGSKTYADLMQMCRSKAKELDVSVDFYQSNHEGELVDIIQQAYGEADGIVINPGAYTHTSVALLDALKAVGIPAIEVHISDVDSREDFRQISYIRSYVAKTISGHGLSGYTEAMEELAKICAKR